MYFTVYFECTMYIIVHTHNFQRIFDLCLRHNMDRPHSIVNMHYSEIPVGDIEGYHSTMNVCLYRAECLLFWKV